MNIIIPQTSGAIIIMIPNASTHGLRTFTYLINSISSLTSLKYDKETIIRGTWKIKTPNIPRFLHKLCLIILLYDLMLGEKN